MVDISRENPNAFKALADKLGELEGVTGKVGWFEGSAYADGTPVAQVAYWQEMGVPKMSIPSRSFFRSTALAKDQEWSEVAAKVSKRVLEGKMSPTDAMQTLVQVAEGDVAEKISTITAPPLSPITVGARKYRSEGKTVTGRTIGEIAQKIKDNTLDLSGVSTKPLVDSALMVNTLTSTVEES